MRTVAIKCLQACLFQAYQAHVRAILPVSDLHNVGDAYKHGMQAAETSEKDARAGQTGAAHAPMTNAELPTSYSGDSSTYAI